MSYIIDSELEAAKNRLLRDYQQAYQGVTRNEVMLTPNDKHYARQLAEDQHFCAIPELQKVFAEIVRNRLHRGWQVDFRKVADDVAKHANSANRVTPQNEGIGDYVALSDILTDAEILEMFGYNEVPSDLTLMCPACKGSCKDEFDERCDRCTDGRVARKQPIVDRSTPPDQRIKRAKASWVTA